MRLKVALLLVLLLGITVVASAQEISLNDLPESIQTTPSLSAWLTGEDGSLEPIQLEPVDPAAVPIGPLANPGSQECSNALPLTIGNTGETPVLPTFILYDPDEPVLSCRWKQPHMGYRTVWYKLTADKTTLLVIDTASSTYDTVLGVHSAGDPDPEQACSTLIELACNDDFNRFTSRVTVPVRSGDTYYIQVGDYHATVQGENTLFVTALPTPLASYWQMVANDPANPAAQRTRHVAIVVENKVYIIAGQNGSGNNMVNTPSSVVYDTSEPDPKLAWQTLQSMPAGAGNGYSYTTAAHVNGKIYIPSGYVGIPGSYDGTHYVYDIAQDRWPNELPSSNNWVGGRPSILAAAVSYPWLNLDGYFLIGGLTGFIPDESTTEFEARAETYFYSDQNDLWFRVPADLNQARFGHVAAEQEIDAVDQICVAGGFGKEDAQSGLGQRKLLSSTECYHISDGNWVPMSTAELNYPRAYADSSVNDFGDWYIYGGFDGEDQAVSAVEVFNRQTKGWEVLDVRFDLGAINLHDQSQLARPPRLWPQGGFVGNTLWVFGGETVDQGIVNIIENAHFGMVFNPFPAPDFFIPLLLKNADFADATNDTFATAEHLTLNQPQQNRFDGENDFVDVYFFDVPTHQQVTIKASQLPKNSTYILELFTDLKDARPPAVGNVGQTQLIETRSLEPGQYYIILQRQFPPPANDPSPPPYTIEVQG